MRKEILEHMAESNSEFKDIAGTMSIKDSIDSAADDIAIKKLEVINKHEANRLRAIEGALDRIHAGRYGTCLRCGKKNPRGAAQGTAVRRPLP
jgi:RNA polymerase-binding transcription factor DksA